MANTYVSLTLVLDGAPAGVSYHCDHDDGHTSWRIDHGGNDTVYVHGTPAQLRAFGEAILGAVAHYRDVTSADDQRDLAVQS